MKQSIDQIAGGFFSPQQPDLFKPLVDILLAHDPFMLLAHYAAYIACQEVVGMAYLNPEGWHHMSILNVARMGKFSSDRAILEYCREIWQVEPKTIVMADGSEA